MRLKQLAESASVELRGADVDVTGVAAFTTATPKDVVFVEDAKYAAAAAASAAGAVIAASTAADQIAGSKPVLVTDNPRLTFARVAEILRRSEPRPASIHPTAVVDPATELATGVFIGPHVFIGPRVKIGENSSIGPGCILISDVEIGTSCEFVAHVTVYPKTRIGHRATVHAGAVLGSDGFGFVKDAATRKYEKFPQIGSLEIGDDVEIGANTTIDRGALSATRVSDGVKLDNLVHLGHNVEIGENVVIAAQTGISGSSVIEREAIIGGQVGIGDHARIEEGVILGSGSGVLTKKVVRGKGVVFWGRPARPLVQYLKELAVLARLTRKKPKE